MHLLLLLFEVLSWIVTVSSIYIGYRFFHVIESKFPTICMAHHSEESGFMSLSQKRSLQSMIAFNNVCLTTQPFTEANLDSLGAIELRNALNQHFNIELPATLAFDHPSITAIATIIATSFGDVDQISKSMVLGSKAHSRQSSFHSVQSEFTSSDVVANVIQNPTEIFAISSRLPSPAGVFRARSCLYVVYIGRQHVCACTTAIHHRTLWNGIQAMATRAFFMLSPLALTSNG